MFTTRKTVLKAIFSLIASAHALAGCDPASGDKISGIAQEAISSPDEKAAAKTHGTENSAPSDAISMSDANEEFIDMTYEEAMEAFAKATPSKNGVKYITCIGDSGAVGFCNVLNRSYEKVVNMGVTGAGLIRPTPPKNYKDIPPGSAVIVSLIGNDVGYLFNASDRRIENHAKKLVGMVKAIEDNGNTPVLMLRGPSNNKTKTWDNTRKRINNALIKAADETGVTYLPLDPTMWTKTGMLKKEFVGSVPGHLSNRAYAMRAKAALELIGVDLSEFKKQKKNKRKKRSHHSKPKH